MSPQAEANAGRYLDEVNTYVVTVHGIHAFCNEVRWNRNTAEFIPDSHYSIGRRMKTTPNNRVLVEGEVTPDFIAQVSSQYGLVGEAKPTLRDDGDRLGSLLDQMTKYDDDLNGWFTADGSIPSNDLIVLTHLSNAAHMERFFRAKTESGEWLATRAFSIVWFTLDTQRRVFVFLQKRWGSFSDDELDSRFFEGVSVPLDVLLKIYSNKFLDSEPPLPYLMMLIWEFILPQLPSEEEFEEAAGVKSLLVLADADDITTRLRDQYGPSRNDDKDPVIPRRAWVVKALEAFAALGMAKKQSDEEGDVYAVNFRRGKVMQDPLRFFAGRLAGLGQRQIDAEWI